MMAIPAFVPVLWVQGLIGRPYLSSAKSVTMSEEKENVSFEGSN